MGGSLVQGAFTMTAAQALDELKARFGLDYQLNALEDFHRWVDFKDKDVLEVGGALPDALVRGHFGARTWIAIDDAVAYERHAATTRKANPLASTVGADAATWTPGTWGVHHGRINDLSPDLDGRFDVVVSIAAFEHIIDMPGALHRMRAALKPGGKLCALVGPIWSGYRGHHLYLDNFPGRAEESRRLVELLRPWNHLVLTRPEMFAMLQPELGDEFAALAVSSIYESNRINRLFAEEYLRHFDNLAFEIERLDPWSTASEVDRALLPAARSRHPVFKRFEWDGFTCVLTPRADVSGA